MAGIGLAGVGVAVAASSDSGGATPTPTPPPPPVNAPPTTTDDTVTGTEDTPVVLTTGDFGTYSDPEGVALASVRIVALPATGALQFNNGTAFVPVTAGQVITAADIVAGKLRYVPAADANGNNAASFTFQVSDGNSFSVANNTVSINLAAVNDAPVNTVPAAPVSTVGTAAVKLGGLSIADVDAGTGTVTTTVVVSAGSLTVGTVTNGATVAGAGTASITLTGTIAQINASLGNLNFTPPTGVLGNITATVTTNDGGNTGTGGARIDTDTFTITVSQAQSGIVSDGYIRDARVFVDVNGNSRFDEGEPTGTTDSQGRFSFASTATGPIVVIGGTNIDTGLPNTVILKAPAGATSVTPISTLVQSLVASGKSVAEANTAVATALGLPVGTDFANYDILAAAQSGDPNALAAQKAATKIVAIIQNATAGTTGDAAAAAQLAVINAISQAAVTSAASGASLDLASTSVLTSILQSSGVVAADMIAAIATSTAQTNAIIASATTLTGISNAQLSAATNKAPTAGADSATTAEDTAVTIRVLANDSDADSDPLRVVVVNGKPISLTTSVEVTGGVVSLNADGSLTFTPNADFNGTPSFTYVVSDGKGGIGTGAVNLTVTAVNDAPVNIFESRIVQSEVGVPVGLGLSVSDVDAGAGRLVVTLAVPAIARLSGIPDYVAQTVHDGDSGFVIYTFEGTVAELNAQLRVLKVVPTQSDSNFGFEIIVTTSDLGNSGAGGAKVDVDSIIVQFTDGAPTPKADVASTPWNESKLIDVLGNDNNPGDLQITRINGKPISANSPVAIAGGTIALVDGKLLFSPFSGFAGDTSFEYTVSDGLGVSASATVDLDVTVTSTLTVTEETIGGAVEYADTLASLGVEVLDVEGVDTIGTLSITDAQAGDLIDAGLTFASDDAISVQAQGTKLDTTLKGLQTLGVDSVVAAAGTDTLSLDVGGGGLASLSDAPLPDFAAAQSDDDLDVTLNVDASTTVGDILPLATELGSAGIDHIDIGGAAIAADVSLTDAQASQLETAGVGFAANDDVTVQAQGTQLSTTLKGLQTLGVDSVNAAGVSTLSVDLGGGGLAGLDSGSLPQFDVDQSDGAVNVTLNVDGDDFDGADLSTLAGALASSGIDHLDVGGSGVVGAATISDAQAGDLIDAGLDFAAQDNVSVQAQGTQLSTTLKGLQTLGVDSVVAASGTDTLSLDVGGGGLASLNGTTLPQFDAEQPDDALQVTLNVYEDTELDDLLAIAPQLGAAGIDTIDVLGPDVSADVELPDAAASQLVAADLGFAANDDVTVQAAGTQLSTTLKGLQTLGVDSVDASGASALSVDLGAGGLSGLDAGSLPQFDVDQSDGALDVTLNVDGDDFDG
ncbi:cadherin-like domain-containing protein, partial [Burkholderia sp.]|uniref:cadherin-like domain-containing protein n=1 Tax=Burkholderia sp. TaxID=36773 RepID=UPI002583ADB2